MDLGSLRRAQDVNRFLSGMNRSDVVTYMPVIEQT